MIDTVALKNKILLMALKGELTEQVTGESSADFLDKIEEQTKTDMK